MWSLVAAAMPPAGTEAGTAGTPWTEEWMRRGYQEMGPLNQRLAEEWIPGELEPRRWEWGGEGG
ncbi:hypothetical protein Tmar_0262 [Thermaerobacter marianensis DSM 12885]|uniref:Uncharacterized protein n=1 Tax=Thermaerobacter marianensis (strain ATCC 700841 / DSM 12885 / JCM 10246 / 7p75a) TaxID=644966 RepID=E6SM57_THEM7|nr:hypothetical protein Tmar_0262 [Thermaerobacter marianensis DSM 12885]